MTSMPHLGSIEPTHRDQMRHADLGGGGDAYYTYDAGGERVRKFIERTGTTTEERIYLGGWEVYRKRTGVGQVLDTKRPDGKQYGMPGGKNADGPNNPVAQASAGVVLTVVAVLSAGSRAFYKKLAKALENGKPLVYSEMKNVGDGVADELAEKLFAISC